MGKRLAEKLVLVGWSGADWKVLRPLLDAGQLPNLAGLIDSGISANLSTLQPQLPSLLWTSLATGKRADKHGVLASIQPTETGSQPASSLSRTCKAFWNILSQAGLDCQVTNWPATHPVEPVDGVMVSELYPWVRGPAESPEPTAPGAVWPQKLAAELEELRLHPAELGLDELEMFVPRADAVDQTKDPRLAKLAAVIARNSSIHGAATELMEQQPWDLHAVVYDALEHLGPGFMQFYPPRLPYIPEPLFQLYRQVIPQMCRFLDMMLGRLIELAGPEATFMIVSERGYHSDHLRPQTAEVAVQKLAAPWIRDQGILVLSGPGILPGETLEGANLLNVTPTLLMLLGLPAGQDMGGKPLQQALAETLQPDSVAGWESSNPKAGRHAPDRQLSHEESQALYAWLAALGEINPQNLDEEQAGTTTDFNLAQVYLSANKPQQALPLLEKVYRQHTDNDRYALHLARCQQALGNLPAARDLLKTVVGNNPSRPNEQMMLSQIHLAEGNTELALVALFRAEQANPNQPVLHCRIGEVYLRMKRWDEAERAFTKALELDPDNALAHHGMAIVHLKTECYEDAVDSALTACGLNHSSPQAHYHLGLALARSGRAEQAIPAFETCVTLNDSFTDAHRWLAELYDKVYGDAEKTSLHRRKSVDIVVKEAVDALMDQPQDPR